MNDLINAVGEKTALLDAAIRQLGKRGQAYAEAESNYRMALSKAILEERANGTPVTIISDVCKGKSDIAKLRSLVQPCLLQQNNHTPCTYQDTLKVR